MTEVHIDRRGLIAAAAVTGAAVAASATAQPTPPPVTTGAAFAPVALPFDPAAIPGLSAKLLTSHHDNNYVGAVKRLNQIEAAIAALDPAAPGFTVNGLKREELIAWNSMILHEVYFGGLGAAGSPSPALGAALTRDFGGVDRWAAQFSATGKALGGGSGWVVLAYSHRDGRLMIQWAADHTMSLAHATPVLVLDMYEHAYAMDYGAKAAGYVDAYMQAINWTAASRRFDKAAA